MECPARSAPRNAVRTIRSSFFTVMGFMITCLKFGSAYCFTRDFMPRSTRVEHHRKTAAYAPEPFAKLQPRHVGHVVVDNGKVEFSSGSSEKAFNALKALVIAV